MYTMKEVCQATGLSYETLKFYCREGLVPNVKRDARNYRVFDDRDVTWIKGLICLRKCGMGMEEMKRYLELCLEGEVSIPKRKGMLEEKKEKLLERLTEVRECLDYIEKKQKFYDDVLAKRITYESSLLKEKEGGDEDDPGSKKRGR